MSAYQHFNFREDYKVGNLAVDSKMTGCLVADHSIIQDWYKVEIAEKGIYSFTFECEDLLNASSFKSYFDIGLYKEMKKGNNIAQQYLFGGINEKILYIGEFNVGVYYLEVASSDNLLNSKYSVSVHKE